MEMPCVAVIVCCREGGDGQFLGEEDGRDGPNDVGILYCVDMYVGHAYIQVYVHMMDSRRFLRLLN